MLLDEVSFETQALLDIRSEPVVIVDAAQDVLIANTSFNLSFGNIQKGDNLQKHLVPLALEKNLEQFSQERSGLLWLEVDGAMRPYEYVSQSFQKEFQSIKFTDVSDKLLYQETIDRSRRNIEDILSHVDSAVYYAVSDQGRPTKLRYVSPRIEDIIGMEVSEIMTYSKTNRLVDIFHPEDWPSLKKARIRQLKGYSVDEVEYRIYHQETGEVRRIRERVVLQDDPVANRKSYFGIIRDITEESKSKQENTRSQRDLSRLIEDIPVGILTMQKGSVSDVNHFAKKYLGWLELSPEEFVGLVKYDDNEIKSAEGKEITVETSGNNNLLNVRLIEALDNDEEGKEFLIFEEIKHPDHRGVARARTQVGQVSREEVRRLQQLLTSIYNSSLDAIMALDTDGTVSLMNRRSREAFHELNKGDKARNLFEQPEEFDQMLGELRKSELVKNELVIKVRQDVITYQVVLTRQTDEAGEWSGALMVIRDITPMVRARRGQQQSEQNYVDLFENSTDAVLLMDKRGNVVYANRQWTSLTGYSKHVGQEICLADHISPEHQEHFNAAKAAARSTGLNQRIHIRLKGQRGNSLDLFGNLGFSKYAGRGLFRINLMNQTELKRSQAQLEEHQSFIDSILSNNSDFIIYALDKEGCFMSYNLHFEKLAEQLHMGVQIGAHYTSVLGEEVKELQGGSFEHSFALAIKGEPSHFDSCVEIGGHKRWFSNHVTPIHVSRGETLGVTIVASDITDRKEKETELEESLKEKEILLKEVHHRVKNNMQVISSMLNLQEAYLRDEKMSKVILESQNRIKTMSLIHESLYRNKDFSKVEFGQYVRELAQSLVMTYQHPNKEVELVFEVENLELSLDQSIPCGLIVNEILSNSMKYAFPEEWKGTPQIRVAAREENEKVIMSISDNGIGLAKGFDIRESDTLGVQLIETLAEQIEASLSLVLEGGTEYCLTFEKL